MTSQQSVMPTEIHDTNPTTRLFLARHGEVDASWRGRIYGRLDVPLSVVGEAQSRAVADALSDVRLEAVYSSGLARAAYAAQLVADGQGLGPHTPLNDFLELDRGRWAGLDEAQIRAGEPDQWPAGSYDRLRAARGAHTAPGGESLDEIRARVVPALDRVARRHPGGAVALVAHLWVLRAAAGHALGLPPERSAHLGLPPGGLIVLDWPCGESAERAQLVSLGASAAGLRTGS